MVLKIVESFLWMGVACNDGAEELRDNVSDALRGTQGGVVVLVTTKLHKIRWNLLQTYYCCKRKPKGILGDGFILQLAYDEYPIAISTYKGEF